MLQDRNFTGRQCDGELLVYKLSKASSKRPTNIWQPEKQLNISPGVTPKAVELPELRMRESALQRIGMIASLEVPNNRLEAAPES